VKKPAEHETELQSRRRFLKTIAAAGGAAVAVAGAGSAVAAPQEAVAAEAPEGKLGYHETQHIKDYYTRADF
jgi:nitrous oxide reductase